MERRDKKGQAAMEFLMTYGWAILVAIIAIGVLAYYGVFNTGKLVSDKVVVNAPFNAKGGQVLNGVAGDSIKLELYNGAGETVTLSNVIITGCTDAGGVADTTAFNAGATAVVTIACEAPTADLGTPGASFKGDITVQYTSQSSTLTQQSSGSINARII